MKELSPVPLYWILKMGKPDQWAALRRYQMENYSCELEVPEYPSDFVVAPVIITTEQASKLMRQKPQRPRRVH